MADIVLTGDPVCGTVNIQDNEEHCVTFPTIYRIIFELKNPGRIMISINNNENYIEYRASILYDFTSVTGIDKIFIKSASGLEVDSRGELYEGIMMYLDEIHLNVWGCKNRR